MSYGWSGCSGTRLVQRGDLPVGRIPRGAPGGLLQVVRRQEREKLPDQAEAVLVVLPQEVRVPRDRVVGLRAAEVLHRDLLVGHGADHVRPGHEHVAGAAGHDREVGDGRGIHGAPRAGPEDGRNLGNDSRSQRVPQEDVGVAGERNHPFLDARAPGVVEPDDGGALPDREVHGPADLLRDRLAQRAAENREVLGEQVGEAPVDPGVAGHDAVPGIALPVEAEIAGAVLDQSSRLFEGPRVHEGRDPLARRQPAGTPLALVSRGAAAFLGAPVPRLEFGEGRLTPFGLRCHPIRRIR